VRAPAVAATSRLEPYPARPIELAMPPAPAKSETCAVCGEKLPPPGARLGCRFPSCPDEFCSPEHLNQHRQEVHRARPLAFRRGDDPKGD
jgi:hypothetical protein